MALSIPYLRGVTVSTCEDYWLTCTCETNEAVWNRSGDKSMFFETSFRSKDSQPFYVIGLYSHLKLSQWPVRDRAAVFIYVIVRSCSFNRTVFAAEWYCVSSCWACWIDPRYPFVELLMKNTLHQIKVLENYVEKNLNFNPYIFYYWSWLFIVQITFACVETSPKEIGDVCTQAKFTSALKWKFTGKNTICF